MLKRCRILALLPWLVWGGQLGCQGDVGDLAAGEDRGTDGDGTQPTGGGDGTTPAGGGGDDPAPAVVSPTGTGYHPVTPYRRLDTRDGKRMASGETRCLKVAGQDGIPDSAKAIVVNLVAVGPTGPGYLVAYPAGADQPATSTVNYGEDRAVANGALVGVGSGGKLCLFALTATDVVVDVSGFFDGGSDFSPMAPYRRIDTREDKESMGGKRFGAEATRCFKVAGQDGIPDSAKALAINLTAVAPSAVGFLAVYPDGAKRPETSTVNYTTGRPTPNGAIVAVGSGGRICVYALTATHVVLDVTGYFGAAADYTPHGPYRRIDTREGSQPLAGSTRCVTVAGRDGVPASASAVAINLAAVAPVGPGFLLARPAGSAQIKTSVLNYAAGISRANGALVQIGVNGKVCVYTTETTHYVLDVVGYWPGQAPAPLAHPRTFKVSKVAGLINALETACCGDRIEIAPSAVIDLTGHRELAVPGDLTITGGRSGATAGGLIRTRDRGLLNSYKTWNLLRTVGPKLVVRGVRLQGPDGTVGGVLDFMAGGIAVRHADVLIEDSELFDWPARAIYAAGENLVVRNNHIHDNIRAGRGYGLNVGTVNNPVLIERNTFGRNRHSIAGGGSGSYTVRHNRFVDCDPAGVHSLVDMHGVNEHLLDNSSLQAGVRLHIHNNDFEYRGTAMPLIGIRGIPSDVAIIEDNCVARTDSKWVVQAVMTAHPSPVSGKSCYEKAGVWLCHVPVYGSAMQKIVVRDNHLGRPSGCR